MSAIEFPLRGEYIPLDALLKASGVAPSGGGARILITDGQVTVDGVVETRKTAKIRAGQLVVAQGQHIQVRPPASA